MMSVFVFEKAIFYNHIEIKGNVEKTETSKYILSNGGSISSPTQCEKRQGCIHLQIHFSIPGL